VSFKTERKLRVFVEDAYLSIDLQQKILTVIRKRPGPVSEGQMPAQIEEQSFDQGDALLAEIRSFAAAIRGEQRVLVSGEDGLRALRTAIAITERVQGLRGAPATALA
jgi:predicted dehydrogenase